MVVDMYHAVVTLTQEKKTMTINYNGNKGLCRPRNTCTWQPDVCDNQVSVTVTTMGVFDSQVSVTARCLWQPGVCDSQVSVTARCLWQSGVCDNKVSVTARCLWQQGVCDSQVSVTARCLWQQGVCDSQVSVTARCLWQPGVCDSKVSVTARCPWQQGICDSQVSVTVRRLWQPGVCDSQVSVTARYMRQPGVHDSQVSVTGVQLRALQAPRPDVPGEGEHGEAPGAVGGRAGSVGPHAHVPLHRTTQGRGGVVGRETKGGRRGAGTMAWGTGPLAVPGGRLQQPRYSQGEMVSQYDSDHLLSLLLWRRHFVLIRVTDIVWYVMLQICYLLLLINLLQCVRMICHACVGIVCVCVLFYLYDEGWQSLLCICMGSRNIFVRYTIRVAILWWWRH